MVTRAPQGIFVPPRVATLLVAANDALDLTRAQADYICDGVNDEVEIQAALDALPAAEGEVRLSEGTFNVEAPINLTTNQTIRGEGINTILTTATDGMIFLNAVGGAGTELTGIVVADMQIDGATLGDCGIYFEFVDFSFILNVRSRRHQSGIGALCSGICLTDSDNNIIEGNLLEDNDWGCGAYLFLSNSNTISGNQCLNNPNFSGISLNDSHYNTITGNVCQGNWAGLDAWDSTRNAITGNILQGNDEGIDFLTCQSNTIIGNIIQVCATEGIFFNISHANTIVGNSLTESSQDITNTHDNIHLLDSDYNLIQSNVFRAGALANVPRYGINISNAACDGNMVIDNDLYDDGYGTAPFNDAGTGTRLNTYLVSFSDGTDPQNPGFLIDVNTEMARTWLRLPDKVSQVVRMKVYARSVVAEADAMRLEFVINGGADNEPFNNHVGSIANHPSTSLNFAADDVIFWTVTTAGLLAMTGGDSITVRVIHEAAGGLDCATNAYFRTVEIEYV